MGDLLVQGDQLFLSVELEVNLASSMNVKICQKNSGEYTQKGVFIGNRNRCLLLTIKVYQKEIAAKLSDFCHGSLVLLFMLLFSVVNRVHENLFSFSVKWFLAIV